MSNATKQILSYDQFCQDMYKIDIGFYCTTERGKQIAYEHYYYTAVLNNEHFANNIMISKN